MADIIELPEPKTLKKPIGEDVTRRWFLGISTTLKRIAEWIALNTIWQRDISRRLERLEKRFAGKFDADE